ncbi:unnamed protein product [Adineta steineri]|uniref:Apple domain-containing protein n=1 Tax=Adineta steineri TaxID=433720 RepID=A0A814J6H6_9BILA|nr:unnamed protein product [Adineta steineri]CAF1068456.1 unnamed protein product [Adineta steineri]
MASACDICLKTTGFMRYRTVDYEATTLSISSRCTEIVAGEDNYGGDMDAAHPAQVHSPAACAALCELYPDCIAWTFYAESGSCWPKNGIPILKTSSDHYTGRCKSA